MFKRVSKRIRKKEREEELGLDGDMKEALGINDIDSEDDTSDSDSDSDSDGGSDDERSTRAQESGSEGEEEDEGTDDDRGNEASEDEEMEVAPEDESEEESDSDEGDPPMSVSEALQNPLYMISLEPEVKACITCPGKLIKNPVMAEVHLKSNAHSRRFVKLREAAMVVDADTDVRLLVRAALAPDTEKSTESLSKRAQKKVRTRADNSVLSSMCIPCRKRNWMPFVPSAQNKRS
ncbi:hypothetical protein C8Q79DRAFT_950242 [Trametes meyenii]|nr:hypothetical protein C8Q79DRAFT_950242 [Trametes meyenii]